MVYGDPGFTIEVDGQMESSGSSVFGARIAISGSLSMNDTSLDRVGPIILENDNASIQLGGNTEFSNSTDDHDVRARGFSTIEWGEDVMVQEDLLTSGKEGWLGRSCHSMQCT